MDRIVDITTDNVHLRAHRGFIIVMLGERELGRIALDDVAALIVHAHGVTWTTSLAVRLAERGAVMVLCAANHAPVAWILPVEGHHAQNARMRAQWNAPLPLSKQAWKALVVAKIACQASLLSACGRQEGEALGLLARRVRSGDPDNLEAQAARRYWPVLMGPDFRRDRSSGGVNALLNYGYTVLRAATARAVLASGLHPTIGVHHANRLNAFALADDLMEPFRPFVDAVVHQLVNEGQDVLDGATKARLAALLATDVDLAGMTSPLSVAIQRLAQSLAASFELGRLSLALFTPPTALGWRGISTRHPVGEYVMPERHDA